MFVVTFAFANTGHMMGSINETERKALNSFKRFAAMDKVVAVNLYKGAAGGELIQELSK